MARSCVALFVHAGDRKLDRDELKWGLRDYGVALTERELDTVLGAFDKNKDGRIDFDELLRGIRVGFHASLCLLLACTHSVTRFAGQPEHSPPRADPHGL